MRGNQTFTKLYALFHISSSPLVSKCLSVVVKAMVRGERGEGGGGAKPDETKHLQNNFYQSSLAKNKVLYLFIYFIKLTEASLHELT